MKIYIDPEFKLTPNGDEPYVGHVYFEYPSNN